MTTTLKRSVLNLDRLWQNLNVVLATAPLLAVAIGEVSGGNARFDQSDATTTPVVPADYAFVIWSLIYGGAVAYAVYQALPAQREHPLLRKVGWYTASAYLATTVWLFAAQRGWSWLTVACIFWMLVSLVGAFNQFLQLGAPRTTAERYFVVLPTSIFLGWVTVATIANTAEVLKEAGFSHVVLPDTAWAVLMLSIGTVIATHVVRASRGNVGYALTVIWALVGVVVANVVRAPNPPVAVTAGAGAALIAAVLLRERVASARRKGA